MAKKPYPVPLYQPEELLTDLEKLTHIVSVLRDYRKDHLASEKLKKESELDPNGTF